MASSFDFDRPLLLDGGTGRELRRRGVPILDTIWSANALVVAPQAVREVHRDYIAAGAVEHGPRLFAQATCHHRPEIYGGIGEAAAGELLKAFFQARR